MAEDPERSSGFESEPDISDDDFGLDPMYTPEQIQKIQNDAIRADAIRDGNLDPAVADAPADAAAGPVSKTKGKRKDRDQTEMTAEVWKHFAKGKRRSDGFYDAKCKYCGHIYQMGCSRGTASMKHHIYKGGCKKLPKGKRFKPDALQRLLVAGSTAGDAIVAAWEFDQGKCRLAFAKMIIVHEYPFNCVTHHYLKVFLKMLQPEFKLMSRNTVRNDCLKLYAAEKDSLYDFFGKLDCKVSFTTGLWTSNNGVRGFMALTAHFIDDDWKLRKRIINFSVLPSPHTGVHIAQAIHDRLVMWDLDKRVFCLVVDNASSNDVCVRELLKTPLKDALPVGGQIFHQRCGCHILNLIVQDGLVVLNKKIENIRETMKYLRHSQGRMENFRLACTQAKVEFRQPNWDVETRWNSTYKMLKLALGLKPAIERFAKIEKRYLFCPTALDWENVGALVEHLKVFYDATIKLSGTKYPTLNLFFPLFCEVAVTISKMKMSHLPFIVEMGKSMFDKWAKYWTSGNALLALACVMDPRCKILVVEYYYKLVNPEDTERFMENVKTSITELFKEYMEASARAVDGQAGSSSQSGSYGSSSQTACVSEIRAGLKEFIKGKKNSEPVKSEIDEYLSEALDDAAVEDLFDILSWWKLKATRYPTLARLARDILAVPISTVASESTFSTGGRVLSPVRNCLNDERIEALICAQDWLRVAVKEAGGDVGASLWSFDVDDSSS